MAKQKRAKPARNGNESPGVGTERNKLERLTAFQWSEIRASFERGHGARESGAIHGVTAQSVNRRARLEGWVVQTQFSCKSKTGAEAAPRMTVIPKNPQIFEEISNLVLTDSLTVQDFQIQLAKTVQSLLAQGVQDLPPPKNWQEAKILNDILRKASGLENKENQRLTVSLVSPVRTLTRRSAPPATRDAIEVNPLDSNEIDV